MLESFTNSLWNNSKNQYNYQINRKILPNSQYEVLFDPTTIKVKELLNKEFMHTPMNNDVAICWFHMGDLTHAALSVDDKPYGFICMKRARERSSLKKTIEEKVNGESQKRCNTITVQYLKISPIKKKEMQQILQEKTFPCLTCMHAVSRILNKTTNIRIPFPISFMSNTSLIYLKNLQESGTKVLSKQKIFGTQGTKEEPYRDWLDRTIMTSALGGISASICYYLGGGNFIPLLAGASLIVLCKIHLAMHASTNKNKCSI